MILVVDDHSNSRIALTKLLSLEGFQAAAARTGLEALDAARRHKPDLIVMDHLMPDMTGLDVLRRLKSDPATADVPVLFYSATSPAESCTQAMELGARDWCLKASVAWPDLLRIIQSACDVQSACDHDTGKPIPDPPTALLDQTRC